jgi:hypothetical protein
MEYRPSKSVFTPLLVPTTIILTPGTGIPSSELITSPVTVFSCAKRDEVTKRDRNNNFNLDFI